MKNIIGQEAAKRKLEFFLGSYRKNKRLPHLMFVAEKGCGKTTLARAVAENLKKPCVEINCSTLKNLTQFFNQYVLKYLFGPSPRFDAILGAVVDKEATIIFDEASELSNDLTMALLTMLNPNSQFKNVFAFEGKKYTIDFSKHTFMFATTEPQKVFHALMDRCERVDLQPYTLAELGQILAKNTDSKIERNVVLEVASVLRGNPRAAQKMSENINCYMNSNRAKFFSKDEWDELKHTLGILPLGLTQTEVTILSVLDEGHPVKLNHIAAKTGLTTSSIQKHFENHLVRNGLIRVEPNGRVLTTEGRLYREKLKLS